MTRETASTGLSLLGALLLFLFALFGVAWMIDDPTPLLTTPRPDLRLPLGLAGVAGGVAAAKWMAGLPHIRDRAGRWSFFVLMPVCLGFGLTRGSERLFELYSFRKDVGTPHIVTAPILEKNLTKGRRGRADRYQARILSPFDQRKLHVDIDQTLFDRIEPSRDCLSLPIERAPNGAARLTSSLLGADRARPCGA